MATERQSGSAGAGGRSSASQGSAGEQAQQKASELTGQAKEQARSRATEQKERATEGLGSMAQALRQTGDNLRDQEQGTVARYVDDAAGQVERLAGYLRDRSPDELLHDAERFARREPALFLGGAFALGLIGARFLKSSGSSASSGRYRSRGTYYQRRAAPVQAVGTTRSYGEPGEPVGRTETVTSGTTSSGSTTRNTSAKGREEQ